MNLKYSTLNSKCFCVATSVDVHYRIKIKNAVVTFSLATIKYCGNNIPRSESPISKIVAIYTH